MSEFVYDDVVIQSKNGNHRYRLFVADDGKLAAEHLFLDSKNKQWKMAETRHAGGVARHYFELS
jgi:hypothetical protein